MPTALGMIRSALIDSLAISEHHDYVIIWLISLTMVLLSIQNGLLLGFVLNLFQVIFQYASEDVVSRRDTLKNVRSAKDRDPLTKELLAEHGKEVQTYRLRGLLFFGNCVGLKQELNRIFDEWNPDAEPDGLNDVAANRPPKYIVIDFTSVVYVDNSVWGMIASVTARAWAVAVTEVYVSGLGEGAVAMGLAKQGETLLDGLRLKYMNLSYLHTMEQLEDAILEAAGCTVEETGHAEDSEENWQRLAAWISPQRSIDNHQLVGGLTTRLQKYFEEKKCYAGEVIGRYGKEANMFFFVVSGEVHILGKQAQSDGDTRSVLIRKLTDGFITGVELFCHEQSSYSELVSSVAEDMKQHTTKQCKHNSTIMQLDRESWCRLQSDDSELCVALLVAVVSRREVLLRTIFRYTIEPETVATADDVRRKFTLMTGSQELKEMRRSSLHAWIKCVGAKMCCRALTKENEKQMVPTSPRSAAAALAAFRERRPSTLH